MRWRQYGLISLMILYLNPVIAKQSGLDPIEIKAVSSTAIPSMSTLGGVYLISYTLTSNLPFTMPTAFTNTQRISAPAGEFTIRDTCLGKKLAPGQSCSISIGLNAQSTGKKEAIIDVTYGNNRVPIVTETITQAVSLDSNWVGLIGVNYQPNHYANGNAFNSHDVFYAGSENGLVITNVYKELSQLKAAGFTAVRSYQTVEYAWIDIITQAKALNLQVIYEANIPQNGSQADITTAVNVLNNVIDTVGASTFENTVSLLFAGHENYSNSDINYLTSAITQLQAALENKNVSSVPVGSALVSGDLVTPSPAIAADMKTLGNTYSSSAPWAFDPYPFQWGVTPPDKAVTDPTLVNSIAWDYAQVVSQSFYVPPRTILMAETGWATSGVGTYAGYFCATKNNCAPSVSNAGTYLSTLYNYVQQTSNNSGTLVFEAYDEPAKDPVHADNAENFYGVFNSNCELKNIKLLPDPAFSEANHPGCKGFTSGALFNVVGGNVQTQPQFSVQISQTNPVTSENAGMTVTVPNKDRTNMSINPWPYFITYNNAVVTINGTGTGNSCNVTVTVTNGAITAFSAVNCSGANVVNCNVGLSACFLPANF